MEPEINGLSCNERDGVTTHDANLVKNTEIPTIDIIIESSKMDVKENRPPLYGEDCLEAEYPSNVQVTKFPII